MVSCAVAKCGNYYKKTIGTGLKYFKFPRNDEICKKWIVACCLEDKINTQHGMLNLLNEYYVVFKRYLKVGLI